VKKRKEVHVSSDPLNLLFGTEAVGLFESIHLFVYYYVTIVIKCDVCRDSSKPDMR
jgi:hypothetical protein